MSSYLEEVEHEAFQRGYDEGYQSSSDDARRYTYLRDRFPIEILLLLNLEAGRNPDDELDEAIDSLAAAPGEGK